MTRIDPTAVTPGRELGFTMVELVVSLSVMAVGVMGAISVFNSSFAVAGGASVRSRAVALATSQIEAFRAVPYDKVALDLQTNVASQRLGGVDFTIEKAVTAADDGSVVAAFKQATVSVSWSDHAGSHAVVQTTLLYPGGLGPHVNTATTTSGPAVTPPPQAPLNLSATTFSEAASSEPAVELAWTVVDESYLAGFSVRYTSGPDHVTVTESLPPGSRAMRVPGLSANTTYTFEVGARPTSGVASVWSTAAPVTTAPAVAPGCSIGAPAIDPAQVARRPPGQGGTLLKNPMFSVNTSGSCAGLRVAYRPTRSGALVSKPLGGTSGLRTGALEDVPAKWDSGTHFIDLYDAADVRRATVKLLVCDNANACR